MQNVSRYSGNGTKHRVDKNSELSHTVSLPIKRWKASLSKSQGFYSIIYGNFERKFDHFPGRIRHFKVQRSCT